MAYRRIKCVGQIWAMVKLAVFRISISGCMVKVVNAELRHRPSCWMVDSGSPASAAAVAAPILKLCVFFVR